MAKFKAGADKNLISEVSDIRKEFRENVKKIYGDKLFEIILYGPWARGEATKDSDIDLMIILNGDVEPEKEFFGMVNIIKNIDQEHSVPLAVCFVSIGDYNSLKVPFITNVRREGVPA